jgi:hypothetical protein
MNNLQIKIYESYVKKANDFFAWAFDQGTFEISAVLDGQEENRVITITDIIAPKTDKILIVPPEDFRQLLKKSIEYFTGYELISTTGACVLTKKYIERINSHIRGGLDHNHQPEEVINPSPQDIIRASQILYMFSRERWYIPEVIHGRKGFEVFCYPRHDLYNLIRREILTKDYVQEWFNANRDHFHIQNVEVIKGK